MIGVILSSQSAYALFQANDQERVHKIIIGVRENIIQRQTQQKLA